MALNVIVNISNEEEVCLLNDLLDIDNWVQKAIAGKINQCKKRLIREWMPKMFADSSVTTMPASEDAFISAVLARPDYKNRAAREAGRTTP